MTEQRVLDYLRREGAPVDDAEWHVRAFGNAKRTETAFRESERVTGRYQASARALLIVAAIRIGFTFNARGKLAPSCEYKGEAAIGGTDADPFDKEPWWALARRCGEEV